MSLLSLQNGLKTILIDHGEDILNDTRKIKALLSDYTGDESREEIKLLLLLLSNNVHLDVLKEKEFDSQTQIQFIRQISSKYFVANYTMGITVANMLFSAFYDFGLLKRRITKNTSMNYIDQKMELWKKKLLNMGKRNRLLNYRDTKRSSLRLVNPGFDEIWSRAVVKGRVFEFPYVDEFDESQNDIVIKKPLSNTITTNQPLVEQQKTLRNLKSKAKSIIEEQGVNVLHLAFGFINWTEKADQPDVLASPVILAPAFLTQKSIASPFTLAIDEDDITVNHTLKYKLENDFGIILPEFDIDNDIQQYFSDVEKIISPLKNWSLSLSVALSLFSFLKINMYNDLEKNSAIIKGNPIVKALCGDITQLPDPMSINTAEYEHDKKNPKDIHQILDADSSQQDAIVSAKKGLSFVLQGPPGTGKSQTIANIIAECLANNKKVLFVSEKVAALDVVFKRLDNAGIGDFCLSLHSHKSNKKEIIEKIAKTLSYNIAEDSGNLTQLYAKLVYYRDQLNNYNDELHVKRLGLQKSIYEGYGELVKFIDEKDIVFEINNISEITGIDLENIILFLEEYVLTLKDNASEQLSNPWFGSTITTHTYELQYELDNNLNTLYQRLLEIIPICDKIETDISLTTKHISDSIEILRDCSNAIKIPYFWVQLDKINIIKKEIDSAEMFFYTLQASISDLNVSLVDVEKTHPQFEKQDVLGIRSTASFNSLLDYYKNFVRNDDLYAIWEKIFNFDDVQTSFYELEIKIKNYVSKKEDILTKYEEEVLDVDAKSLLKRFQLDYTSIFRYLKKQYYVDRRLLLGQTKNISKKIKKQGVEVFIADLKMLCELKELQEWFELKTDEFLRLFGECYNGANTDVEKLSEKIRNFRLIIRSAEMFTDLFQLFKKYDELDIQFSKDFSFLYNGYDTDWNYLKNAAVWAVRVCQMKKEMAPDENFIKLICEDESMPEKCAYYHAILSEKSEGLIDLLRWFYKLFDETIFKMSSPGVMLSKISACKDNIAALNNWIDYSSAKAKCISLGLESFILAVEKEGINKSKIIPVYKNHFYRKWLDCAMKESSVLKSFKRQNHENMINEFKQLDKWQFSMANRRIGELFIDKILSQSIFSQNGNEIKILQKELNKKRRIMPIRKLFQNIPNLLLTLKPCLMMSPLTVSLFLESNQFNFDIVIFDEASQVCTENAIGAISRGKQLVLAGDSKQLPPTSFFMAAISDQEYDEEDKDDYTDVDSYESILDEADSFSFPSQTLKWHYRSRHEHLIAFSNSKIYNNKLITFPSNIERTRNYGVEYIYVENGVYDKGGKRDNIEEAKKVVELIFENFRNFPNRSLGVITFSVSQRETIETVLRKERLSNLDFNDFFNEEKDESFFIKNIETVQGDERDTIIFSIGYAKDYAGKMSMFFGPLSSTGGERRLNVAITRAKYNVKLVGSILPLDIKTERITSEGPKLLRAYMDFAINGAKILKSGISVNSDDQTESPFEQSVYEFLIGQGFKVSTQIGCSGFRIDMGIHDPNDYSSFCLGIECDGPTYHSARTARERDRLRQTILEDMGWNIYRIWSTDWLKNPEYEKNRLLQAVNDTISDISRSGRTV